VPINYDFPKISPPFSRVHRIPKIGAIFLNLFGRFWLEWFLRDVVNLLSKFHVFRSYFDVVNMLSKFRVFRAGQYVVLCYLCSEI
jgi:hypothetical protein